MAQATPARILRVHVSEGGRCDGKPLFEAIVAKCREMQIAGATVLRGLEGFGETAELRRHPIVIVVVDSAEKIERLRPAIEEMIGTGMIAVSDAEMIRVQKAKEDSA